MLAGTGERPSAAAGEAAGQMMDEAVRGSGPVGPQPTALQPRPFPSTPCRHLGGGLTVFRCNLPFLPSSTGPGRVPSDQSPVREVGHPLPFTVRETDDSVTRWGTRDLARSPRLGTAGRGQSLPFTQSLGRPSSTCPSIRISADRRFQSRGPRTLADAGRKGCDQASGGGRLGARSRQTEADNIEGSEGDRSDCPQECQSAVFSQDEPLRPSSKGGSDGGWVQAGEDRRCAGKGSFQRILHFDMLPELRASLGILEAPEPAGWELGFLPLGVPGPLTPCALGADLCPTAPHHSAGGPMQVQSSPPKGFLPPYGQCVISPAGSSGLSEGQAGICREKKVAHGWPWGCGPDPISQPVGQ